MGKSSSAKQDVVEYLRTLHVGIALELDSIQKILVDEKEAWSGNISANTTLPIRKTELFGGPRKEGGLLGSIDVLFGREDQILPAAVASRYGKPPEDCPAFRGITTLFFRGAGQVSTAFPGLLEYFGSGWTGTSGSNGFSWKHNTPLIAQKIEVVGTCAPKGLSEDNLMIGVNANPAAIIYECLVGDEYMNVPPSLVGIDSFEAAAAQLKTENFGLTLFLTDQIESDDFVSEILDHIQATFFINPNTGHIEIKLLRGDYDLEGLRVITPQNAKLLRWRVRSPGEIINEVTVQWTNPLNEKQESITAQNLASIDSQDGQRSSTTHNYYGIRDKEVAQTVLERDLRAASAPLVSCDGELDRSFWDALPGEVFKVNWPRRADETLVMRAGRVNYGKPGDAVIKVPLLQDIFSLSMPPITLLPPTEWVDPSAAPQPLTMQLMTLPSYFTRNGELNRAGPIEVGDGEVLVASLADSQDADSLDYELVSESLDAGGATIVTRKGSLTLTPLSALIDALPAEAVSELPIAVFPDITHGPLVGGFVVFGAGDAAQEIALVTGRTDTGLTLSRGVLDTVPRAWAVDTPVWAINNGARIVDEQTIHAAGDTVTYRGLDRTTQGLLDYDDAADVSVTLTDRPHLPLRPANVKVETTAFGTHAIGAATDFDVTWACRNRLLEDTQVLAWTDGNVAPEHRQETVIRVYNVAGGALVAEYGHLWTETSKTFLKSSFDRFASIRVEVLSRRDDLESLHAHSIIVSGFANNPAAPLPPSDLDRSPPPSTLAEPGVGAFSAAAGVDTAADGTRLPTIVITGQQDNAAAEQLVVRYRVAGATEWQLWPSVPLDREILSFPITGLLSATEYEVGVAYVVGGLLGRFRSLANVTTVSQVSGDVSPTSPVLGEVISNNFDQVAQAFEARITEENQRRHQDDDSLDRFDVLGNLNPIDRTAVLRGDAISTAPEGLLLEDVSDRVGAGLSPWGEVALPIPSPVGDDSGFLRRFGGGAGGVAGEIADLNIITTPFVEERNITRLARYESSGSQQFTAAYSGPVLSDQVLFQAALTATGETIVVAGKFLARIHHSQDDFDLILSVWRQGSSGPAVKVFEAQQKAFVTNGDGFISGWQCMDFSDTPAAGATTYSVRVRHTYSIGGPGAFVHWLHSNRTFDFREHLR